MSRPKRNGQGIKGIKGIKAELDNTPADLASLVNQASTDPLPSVMMPPGGFDLERYLDRLRRAFVEEALWRVGGEAADAAVMLRMGGVRLAACLRRWAMEDERVWELAESCEAAEEAVKSEEAVKT